VLCITEEDRQFFIDRMQVQKNKCIIFPYGIEQNEPPTDKAESKHAICKKHNLDPDLPLLFFNGALDYKPNIEALEIIVNEIQPRLISKKFIAQILIAGRNLPKYYKSYISEHKEKIVYAGFVDDISLYTKAADILLNPVVTGGGVKTKMIEALGLNTTVVSTETGAAGVAEESCGKKLKVVADGEPDRFADAIIETFHEERSNTPPTFYTRYHWKNIIDQLLPQI
jgi:hypothetical protein